MKNTNFEVFWKEYPRKVGKGNALKAWIKAEKDNGAILHDCLASLEWQKKQEQWQDPKYIPHASTYLNQWRWMDEPDVKYEDFTDKEYCAKNFNDPDFQRKLKAENEQMYFSLKYNK